MDMDMEEPHNDNHLRPATPIKYQEVSDEANNSYFHRQWLPQCHESLIPKIGMVFKDLNDGIQFYRVYATEAGFDVRKTTTTKYNGSIVWQYMVCSREGRKHVPKVTQNAAPLDSTSAVISQPIRRRRVSNRVGCMARVAFRIHGQAGYIISLFEDHHTHPLTSLPSRPFLKINRNIDLGHKKFILNCAKANIGTMKSYRLFKESVGGYTNVGATAIDFKNFKRDLKAYIAGGDAQMVIDKLFRKSEVSPGFRFDYEVDESDQLSRLFWCDAASRKSYSMFGDVVSFDATYKTNRYLMIFAPFTGVDNHRKCVTFAFGILSREDAESYSWLLRCFMNAMGNAPQCIITDQDPSMRIAIEEVLPQTKHRYCMWHIMNKLSGKVGPILSKDTEFMNRINNVVWTHYLDKKEWKLQWRSVLQEYNLTDHSWFKSLYTLRKFWIPAYFRDLFMAGLLRTTSRSESENSFFDDFSDRNFSLVELLMQFDSAMEAQRYKFIRLNAESESGIPVFKTPLHIEKHAASMFTLSVFYDVQKEITSACFSCCVVCINKDGFLSEYQISDISGMISTVHYNSHDGSVSCSCKNYERIGLLCRHIFVVYKNLNIEKIPERYVTNRWCKYHFLKPMFQLNGLDFEKVSFAEENKPAISRLISDFHACIALVENNPALLQSFSETIKQLKEDIIHKLQDGNLLPDTSSVFVYFCGTVAPTQVRVLPPVQSSNKGSGKRIKGGKETSIEENKKPKRLCRTCKEYGHHDGRNCPTNNEC